MLHDSSWHPVRLGDLVRVKHGWPFKSDYFNEELTGRPLVVNYRQLQVHGWFPIRGQLP